MVKNLLPTLKHRFRHTGFLLMVSGLWAKALWVPVKNESQEIKGIGFTSLT
jgi:hypothetical protein